jgi:hypothetical protein
MMDNQTIAAEWDDYRRNVLAINPTITPELIEPLRMVFYSGACASLTLIGTGTASIAALREELRAHQASVRAHLVPH